MIVDVTVANSRLGRMVVIIDSWFADSIHNFGSRCRISGYGVIDCREKFNECVNNLNFVNPKLLADGIRKQIYEITISRQEFYRGIR